ncbi:MAG TPA: S1C family serine protease [Chloroflexota bacterium]
MFNTAVAPRRTAGRLPLRATAVALLMALLWLQGGAPAHAASDTLPDFAIVNGYYFSEAAGGDPANDYTITNEGGIPFWDAFQRLGDVDAIGYPATSRFLWQGFVDQATQKLVLQWNPATLTVNVVNIFDVLAQLGFDPQLQAKYQTPPAFDNSADAGKPWDQVVARHQAELDWNAAIKARYFADSDPIAHFGLPQSYADEGSVLVVRCQRAVIQQWKVAEPWASAGQVTIANGGDVAKALGVLPANAAATTSASSLIDGPFGDTLSLTPAQQQAVRAAAAAIRPSLVAIAVQGPNNQGDLGSGMVFDANGDILTDAHVVAASSQAQVLLPNGQITIGQVIGRDFLADIAIVHIPISGLTPVTFGSSAPLQPGAPLVSLGYSPIFPSPPALRTGQLVDTTSELLTGASITRLVSDVADVFGDSGSPVVNLQGQVVGIVGQIFFSPIDGSPQFSIDTAFQSVQPIAQQIIARQNDVTHIVGGFDAVALTPTIARQAGIPFVAGELVFAVLPGSSAAKAGMVPGDIITSLDNTATTMVGSYIAVLSRHKAGDIIPITFTSPDGKTHTASITLQQI